ncbi:permease [Brachybacterium endophyticum]|uniref:Permease n=1 Tax=Brachybacterium endophyticum TaxID=2182385 RepID=A0A2U2RN26_9MICO|nr:permease [Brachybacterium endophyticum]PWH07273.1 permease [Brachybacterium endophyticum]
MSSTPASSSPGPTWSRPSWRFLGPVLAVLLITVLGLLWAKWFPYTLKTIGLAEGGQWDGSVLSDTAVDAPTWWQGGWDFLVTYTLAIWRALLVALLISAAVQAFLGPERLARLIAGGRGATRAALAGVPAMMCTCCTAPVVVGLRRSGVPVRAAAAFWLANPVLNPAVIVFLALIGPWQWAAVRVVIGIALMAGAAALAGRLAPRATVDGYLGAAATAAAGGTVTGAASAAEPASGGAGAVTRALLRFGREFGRLAVRLVPEYLGLVFVVGVVLHLGGWRLDSIHWGLLAVLVFAVIAVLMVIPTAGEIPVLLALAALGGSPWAQGIALICLSAVSLPSLVMVGRSLSWRASTGIAGAVLVAGVVAGALLAVS